MQKGSNPTIPPLETDESVLIDTAIDYFYEQGINEEGLDLIIEEVGLDDFVDFVDDSAEFLTEEEGRSARKMNVRTLKATKKKAEEIKADKSDVVKKPGLKDVLSRARTERSFKKPKLAKPSPKTEAPAPAPTKVCSSSTKRITFSCPMISFIMPFRRASN